MSPSVRAASVALSGSQIHYLEAGRGPAVLLLHGASFDATTWQSLGTLALLAERGYRAIAIDLPDYGESQRSNDPPEVVLPELLAALALATPAIVSPSMSGRYSLPLLVRHPEAIAGFVAVAPVGIERYEAQLQGLGVPTLAVWGGNDRTVPPAEADRLCQPLLDAEKVVLDGAGHACYMQATEAFHQHLLAFLQRCCGEEGN
ncbi:MAG: alpha/beta hydrolase [Cyanobacteria bacterium QS_8_64_29]|nr:MAG: alpha/beta hydrolase [Cyanobacteria bacterium QS_8_64_29]